MADGLAHVVDLLGRAGEHRQPQILETMLGMSTSCADAGSLRPDSHTAGEK
jgi:hypothetical protein